MNENIFVRYIGDYRAHDSIIRDIIYEGDEVLVYLASEEGERIAVRFIGVKSISSSKLLGIRLYSISELKEEPPFRKFILVNTNDDGESLEIISRDCLFDS